MKRASAFEMWNCLQPGNNGCGEKMLGMKASTTWCFCLLCFSLSFAKLASNFLIALRRKQIGWEARYALVEQIKTAVIDDKQYSVTHWAHRLLLVSHFITQKLSDLKNSTITSQSMSDCCAGEERTTASARKTGHSFRRRESILNFASSLPIP